MADAIDAFLSNVASQLDSKQVKVGFIDGATYPDGTPVVLVAATGEYGNPANNQPRDPSSETPLLSTKVSGQIR